MDPLSAYLLSVVRGEASSDTQAFIKSEQALQEMGYWLLRLPSGWTRSQMPETAISRDCRLIEEFPSYEPCIGKGYDGFATIVEVYADPLVVGRES